jgi:hypothetical protein
MKTGNRIVFWTSQENASKFSSVLEEIPWIEVMSFQGWRQTYKGFLKAEEDVDFLGTPGNFKMKDTFCVALLIEGSRNPEF